MTVPDLLQTIVERLQSAATVKTVYGDPIEVNGKNHHPGGESPVRLWGGVGAAARATPVAGAEAA